MVRAGRVGSEEQHYDLGLKPVRHSPDRLTRSILIAWIALKQMGGRWLMYIIYEFAGCVALLTVLCTLRFGFCPVFLTIRRGNERLGRRSRKIRRDGTHFFS